MARDASCLSLESDYAFLDAAHCLTPGLFRSLKRTHHRPKLETAPYRYGDEEVLSFCGPAQLGPEDLLVLQGIVSLAYTGGPAIIPPEPAHPITRRLRQRLKLHGPFVTRELLRVITTKRRLLAELGLMTASGRSMRMLDASLERLAAVTCSIRTEYDKASSRLIAYQAINSKLYIALSPRLSRAASPEPPYTRIDMNEVRRLRSGPARVLHQRLSASLSSSSAPSSNYRARRLETLIEYVWSDCANPETTKKRRYTVQHALDELRKIGWHIDAYAIGKYRFFRPGEAYDKRKRVRANRP